MCLLLRTLSASNLRRYGINCEDTAFLQVDYFSSIVESSKINIIDLKLTKDKMVQDGGESNYFIDDLQIKQLTSKLSRATGIQKFCVIDKDYIKNCKLCYAKILDQS